jgi:hypothetical protein
MPVLATREPTQTRARTHGASAALRALVVTGVLLAAVLFGVSVLADGFIDDGSEFYDNETVQYNSTDPTVETGETLTSIEYVGEPLTTGEVGDVLRGELDTSAKQTLDVATADGGTIRYQPRADYTASEVEVVYESLPANGSEGIEAETWTHTTTRDNQQTANITPTFDTAGSVIVAEAENGTEIDVTAADDGTLGYNTTQVRVGDNVTAWYEAQYDRSRVSDNSEQMLAAILPRLNTAGELAPVVLFGLVAIAALAMARRI